MPILMSAAANMGHHCTGEFFVTASRRASCDVIGNSTATAGGGATSESSWMWRGSRKTCQFSWQTSTSGRKSSSAFRVLDNENRRCGAEQTSHLPGPV